LVITATYGLGDAPTNAAKFLAKLKQNPQPNQLGFSVLGFGSHAYPEFCKFAYEVNNALLKEDWANPLLEIHTVNDKSPVEFENYTNVLSQKLNIPITVSSDFLTVKPKKLQNLEVIEKTAIAHEDGAFLIKFRCLEKVRFTSGDLLAIFPANDYRERLYSIGKVDDEIQLSVKLHPNGLGSSFLYNLNNGDKIQAVVNKNKHFHFPKKAKQVIMISNGTGIAPFLGMIDENKNKIETQLYCGFRDTSSYELYRLGIENYLETKRVSQVNVAYSREGEKIYVKDLVLRDGLLIADALKNNGIIMICGSLAMQQMVLEILETICQKNNGKSLSFYQSRNQIMSDCY
jgi:sulfite reductase (NADPH) flavoprotein alpha-component